MMRPLAEIARHPQVRAIQDAEDGGSFHVRHASQWLTVIASFGMDWDHISVSLRHRCPRWEEMEAVKRIFFRSDEVCMQLHVSEADHISMHPNCLHIWRPQNQLIPLPPSIMVAL